MAQSVKGATSAQVMISQFVSSSPEPGSVLTARSPEPALDSVPSSLLPNCSHSVSLENKHSIAGWPAREASTGLNLCSPGL